MSELDHSINSYIPLFFYEVYMREDGLYGHLVDWKPAWESEKDYLVVYHINGKEARYWIGTDDASILRDDALSFAIRVHTKRARILHIDLSEVSP
jgi:hypothetical protein